MSGTTNAADTSRTEWVAVLHGQNGTTKAAYLSPAALADGLVAQTAAGYSVAQVYVRERQTYNEKNFPELAP